MKIHSLLLLTIFSFSQVHAEIKFTPLFVSEPYIPEHFKVSHVACINVDNFDSDSDPEIIFGESDYLYGTKVHLIDKKSDGQYIDKTIADSVKVGVGDNLVISDRFLFDTYH